MSDSLKRALESLENQIGFEPGTGYVVISGQNRKQIISWLTIKGLKDLSRNSDETLEKLYGIPSYLRTALNNQQQNQRFPKRKNYSPSSPSSLNDLVIDDDDGLDHNLDSSQEKTLDQEHINELPLSPSQLESHISQIAKRIISSSLTDELLNNRKTLTDALNQTTKQSHDALTNRIISLVKDKLNDNVQETKQMVLSTIQEFTKNQIENELQIQRKESKAFIEETIFKSYLNQRINHESHVTNNTSPDEIPNENSQNHSSFIPQIDPNYHFDTYATRVIRSALNMSENLYVFGDTGCGKTTHLEQVCGVMSHGLIRINPHDGITREMFLGSMKLINNETIFVPGALPLAMKNGYVFLVDEISFLPPNLTAILNPIGEKNGKLYIPETSEWISPAPGFCIFATDNTGGKGDRTGNYTGTEVQNTATLDRFAFCLKMDYLPKEKEKEMLEKRFPTQDKNEIEKMLSFARDIRSAFSRGELSLTLSTRKLIKFFDQRQNGFSIQESLSNTILSWLDEDDEILVKTLIDRFDLGGVVF